MPFGVHYCCEVSCKSACTSFNGDSTVLKLWWLGHFPLLLCCFFYSAQQSTALFTHSWAVGRSWELNVDPLHPNTEDLGFPFGGPHFVRAGSSIRPSSLHETWALTVHFPRHRYWTEAEVRGVSRSSNNVFTSPVTDIWPNTGPWASQCIQFYRAEQASGCCEVWCFSLFLGWGGWSVWPSPSLTSN